MRNLAADIWVAEQPYRMLGINYGIRMTLVRLKSSELVLISPIPLTPELVAKVKEIGVLKYIVGPNSFHHLFIKPWCEAFPDAALLLVPQVAKKRKDLSPTAIINESFKPEWSDDLRVLYVPGSKMYAETVFLHAPSHTLILTDLCFNMHNVETFYEKFALKLYGIYKKFGPSKAVALFMRDKTRLRKALDEIGSWEFQRVIVAHGEVLERTTPAALLETFNRIIL